VKRIYVYQQSKGVSFVTTNPNKMLERVSGALGEKDGMVRILHVWREHGVAVKAINISGSESIAFSVPSTKEILWDSMVN
jgi:hypothetical protein